MPYSQNIEQLHKLTYRNNVDLAQQQLTNPVAIAATVMPATGEAHAVSDLLGKLEYMRGEPRRRSNVENPVSASRRWVVYDEANTVLSGQYIDREDKFKAAMDPTGTVVRAHTGAVTRGQMDQMLGIELKAGVFRIERNGLYGLATEGKRPGQGTALPAAQYLTADSDGLTLDKLMAAVEMLQKKDFGINFDMDPLYGLITPKQKTDLLKIAAAAGTNLNAFDIKQLESGKPTSLMGVNWIMSNRVPVGATGAPGAGKRLVAIWAKSNLIAGEWEPLNGDIWNDTHSDNLPYARVRANLDAVRAQDEGVAIIPCTE